MGETDPTFEELFLLVSSVAASKEFYHGKLGSRVEHEGGNFVILHTGRTKILLHDAEGEAVRPGGLFLAVRVDDVDRWHERLSAQGVRFQRAPFEVHHEGDPWSPRREARLSDPDGYQIALFSPLEKATRRRKAPETKGTG